MPSSRLKLLYPSFWALSNRSKYVLTSARVLPHVQCTDGRHKKIIAMLTSQTPSAIVSLRRAERKRATLRSRRLAEDVSDDEWADTDGRAVADGGDDEDDEAADEALTWGDTLLFPILGSVVLLGFYLIITYAGKEWINRILGVYCRSLLLAARPLSLVFKQERKPSVARR